MGETKRLVLRELIKAQEAIWVVNNTGNDGVSDRPGNIVMQIDDAAITVPPGNDPVCLSDQADYDSLKKCRDLFKLVDGGGLTLLDPTEAEKYYSKNVERRKLVKEKMDRAKNKIPTADEMPVQGTETSIQISSKVQSICLQARHEKIKENIALESLIEQEKSLKLEDYEYLAINGHYDSITAWARNKAQELGVSAPFKPKRGRPRQAK